MRTVFRSAHARRQHHLSRQICNRRRISKRSGFALLRAKRKQKSKPADSASNNYSILRASPFATSLLAVDAFYWLQIGSPFVFIFRCGENRHLRQARNRYLNPLTPPPASSLSPCLRPHFLHLRCSMRVYRYFLSFYRS